MSADIQNNPNIKKRIGIMKKLERTCLKIDANWNQYFIFSATFHHLWFCACLGLESLYNFVLLEAICQLRIYHNLPKRFFTWCPRAMTKENIFRDIAFVEYLFELLRDRVKCREFDKPQLTFSHLCRMRYILQPWLLTRLLICPAETFYGKCTAKKCTRCRSVWSNVLIFRCYKSKYQKIDRT